MMTYENAPENKEFSSKILLFGEYSIILNSRALCLPFPLFKGQLTFAASPERGLHHHSHQELTAFADYLEDLLKDHPDFPLDIGTFRFDLAQGLYFSSTIPQGHGVGSSGALVAAIFDRYGRVNRKSFEGEVGKCGGDQEVFQRELVQLKEHLAQMEGHFHGQSSGIDPLVSYLNRPLLILSKERMGPVSLPMDFYDEKGAGWPENEGQEAIFLLNTKRPRSTGPLVKLFLEKNKEKNFQQLCHDLFLPLNRMCIDSFIAGDKKALFSSFHELSTFQYEHLEPMIPHLFKKLWKQGLSTRDYCLKLCGAGGGGFLLGMTPNYQVAKQKLHPYEIRRIF